MENPTNPEPNTTPPDKSVQPSQPEINPAEPGNATEVDLDKTKTKTYPDQTPPERH